MQTRAFGNDTVGRVEVGAIGLGAMAFLQPEAKDRAQILRTIEAALAAGVTMIDTADAYGPDSAGADAQGQSEELVAGILDELGARERVLLATKGGHVRTEGGGWARDSTARHLRESVDASLRRLGVEQIDLYQHHRPDPAIPYEDAMGTIKEIYEAGKARMVGISNADPDQIRAARDILGDALVSVQNQFSPAFRSSEAELQVADELGLAFLPWSPLGGIGNAAGLGAEHAAFADVANELRVSPQQVTLAWMLAKSPLVIPIPGASRPESIQDSAAATGVTLSDEQYRRLDAA